MQSYVYYSNKLNKMFIITQIESFSVSIETPKKIISCDNILVFGTKNELEFIGVL